MSTKNRKKFPKNKQKYQAEAAWTFEDEINKFEGNNNETKHQKNEEQSFIKRTPKVIVQVPEQDKSEEIKLAKQNFRVSLVSSIASAVLLICTIYALFQTREAIEVNKEAIKISNSSLEETRKQFNVQNDPILQIDTTKFYFSKEKNTDLVRINYQIRNVKNTPVKLLMSASNTGASMGNKFDVYQSIKRVYQLIKERNEKKVAYINLYCLGGDPVQRSVSYYVDNWAVDSIMSGNMYYHFTVGISYLNLINNDTLYYLYHARIKHTGGGFMNIDILFNDNRKDFQ